MVPLLGYVLRLTVFSAFSIIVWRVLRRISSILQQCEILCKPLKEQEC